MKTLLFVLLLCLSAIASCTESAPLSKGFEPIETEAGPLRAAVAEGGLDASSPDVAPVPVSPDSGAHHELVTWEAHFSPKGGCTDALVAAIGAAKVSVHVQTYTFTSVALANALAAAKARGVDVEIIADDSDLGDAAPVTTQVKTVLEAGVTVWSDAKHAIAHNKVMIFDGKRVETGSFNYTLQAEVANAENCLFVLDKNLAATYEQNWQFHKWHSTRVP